MLNMSTAPAIHKHGEPWQQNDSDPDYVPAPIVTEVRTCLPLSSFVNAQVNTLSIIIPRDELLTWWLRSKVSKDVDLSDIGTTI